MSFHAELPTPAVLKELAIQGWQWAHANDSTHLFWRDRVVHVRTALDLADRAPVGEIPGIAR